MGCGGFSNYAPKFKFVTLNKVFMEEKDLKSQLKDSNCFYKICTKVLNQHAPGNKKYIG